MTGHLPAPLSSILSLVIACFSPMPQPWRPSTDGFDIGRARDRSIDFINSKVRHLRAPARAQFARPKRRPPFPPVAERAARLNSGAAGVGCVRFASGLQVGLEV